VVLAGQAGADVVLISSSHRRFSPVIISLIVREPFKGFLLDSAKIKAHRYGDDSNEANQIVLVLLSADCRFNAFAMGGPLFAIAKTANGRDSD
jgi:hypothetical protein